MPGWDIVFLRTNLLANIGEGSSGAHPEGRCTQTLLPQEVSDSQSEIVTIL